MQAVELAVFFLSSIVVGSLIILFLTNLDAGKVFGDISKMIFPETATPGTLAKVTFLKFHNFVYDCWQKCDVGETFLKCGIVYITDGNLLDAETLAERFHKYNFCLDCNVEVTKDGKKAEIELPAVVQVDCNNSIIIIRG